MISNFEKRTSKSIVASLKDGKREDSERRSSGHEENSAHQTFEETRCCVATRRQPAQHLSEEPSKDSGTPASRDS